MMDNISREAQAIEKLFRILPKWGGQVDFILNDAQRRYDVQKTNRDIIAKARQKGFSSLGVAYQVIDCLGKPGSRCVLISHEASATQRLLDKAHYYIKYMKGPPPELGRHSRNELYFPKTESTYYIGTAGARAFGRGDTITHLHISEYAWWESDALQHVAGLMQAVPAGGIIRIESTGNGQGNDFFYMTKHAKELGYNVFFRAWWEDMEYSKEPPAEGWAPVGFEHYFEDMRSKFNLTDTQLFWYWEKLKEFRYNIKVMQQEYPSSVEECFQATGGQVYTTVQWHETAKWEWSLTPHNPPLRFERLTGHPDPKYTYVMGMDAAGGTGNDEAAIQIVCLETLEQVFEFGSNTIGPVAFAKYGIDLGKQYNEAYVVPESNNHGATVVEIFRGSDYPKTKIYKTNPTSTTGFKYGLNTSEQTKKVWVGATQEILERGLQIHGKRTIEQMEEFSEDDKGKLGADEDGLVAALGLASVGVKKWYHLRNQEVERPKVVIQRPKGMFFTFDEVMKKRNTDSVIAKQRDRQLYGERYAGRN